MREWEAAADEHERIQAAWNRVIENLKLDLKRFTAEKATAKAHVEQAASDLKEIGDQLKSEERRLVGMKAAKLARSNEIALLRKERQEVHDSLRNEQREYQAALVKSQGEKTKRDSLMEERNTLKEELARLKAEFQGSKSTKELLTKEILALESGRVLAHLEHDKVEAELAEKRGRLSAVSEQGSARQKELSELTTQKKVATRQMESIAAELERLTAELAAKRTDVTSLNVRMDQLKSEERSLIKNVQEIRQIDQSGDQ